MLSMASRPLEVTSVTNTITICVQAARAASSVAAAAQQQMQQQDPREPLPAFGSGIEFRPTKKAKQQGSSQGPQKSAALPNLPLDDDMDDDGGGNDVAMQQVSQPALVSFECAWCQTASTCMADAVAQPYPVRVHEVLCNVEVMDCTHWSNHMMIVQLLAQSVCLDE